MGCISFRRHRQYFAAERVLDGLESTAVFVKISNVVCHEAGEPDFIIDLLVADLLSGEDVRKIHLLGLEADATAGGDDDSLVVKGVVNARQARVGTSGAGVVLGWRLHVECLVRALVVEVLDGSHQSGLAVATIAADRGLEITRGVSADLRLG